MGVGGESQAPQVPLSSGAPTPTPPALGTELQPSADLSTLLHLPGAFQGGFPLTPGSWAWQGLTSHSQGHSTSDQGHIPSPPSEQEPRIHANLSFTTPLFCTAPGGQQKEPLPVNPDTWHCAPSSDSSSWETLSKPLPSWARGVWQVPPPRRS